MLLLLRMTCAVVCCGVQVAEDVFRIAGRDPMIEVAIALQVSSMGQAHCDRLRHMLCLDRRAGRPAALPLLAP